MGTAKRLTSTFLVLGLLILGSYGKALAEPAPRLMRHEVSILLSGW